jgi:hypothetical protein
LLQCCGLFGTAPIFEAVTVSSDEEAGSEGSDEEEEDIYSQDDEDVTWAADVRGSTLLLPIHPHVNATAGTRWLESTTQDIEKDSHAGTRPQHLPKNSSWEHFPLIVECRLPDQAKILPSAPTIVHSEGSSQSVRER